MYTFVEIAASLSIYKYKLMDHQNHLKHDQLIMKQSYEIQLISAEKLTMPFLSIASPKQEYEIGIFQTLNAIRNLMDNIR